MTPEISPALSAKAAWATSLPKLFSSSSADLKPRSPETPLLAASSVNSATACWKTMGFFFSSAFTLASAFLAAATFLARSGEPAGALKMMAATRAFLRAVELVLVLVVVLLQLGLGQLLGGARVLEGPLDQLLDHDLPERQLHLGVLVEPLPLRLLGQHLEADQVVEELLLPLQRRVAGADEGRLLIEAGLELIGGDGDVLAGGDGRAGLLGSGVAAGGQGSRRR